MTPAEKSLNVVKDLINIVEGVQVQGKDAQRIAHCLGYLDCLRLELEKDVKEQKSFEVEANSEQASV